MSEIREKSLRVFRQFTRGMLLSPGSDAVVVGVDMEESRIMLILAHELIQKMVNADTIFNVMSSLSSWEEIKLHAVGICNEICSGETCHWGRIVSASVYALEIIRKYADNDDIDNSSIDDIATWLYDDIVNTVWIENHSGGWNEFIRIFGEKEKTDTEEKKRNILLITILIFLPVSVTFIVLYSLFK